MLTMTMFSPGFTIVIVHFDFLFSDVRSRSLYSKSRARSTLFPQDNSAAVIESSLKFESIFLIVATLTGSGGVVNPPLSLRFSTSPRLTPVELCTADVVVVFDRESIRIIKRMTTTNATCNNERTVGWISIDR